MQSQDNHDKINKSQIAVCVLGVVTIITLAYAFYKNINNSKKQESRINEEH